MEDLGVVRRVTAPLRPGGAIHADRLGTAKTGSMPGRVLGAVVACTLPAVRSIGNHSVSPARPEPGSTVSGFARVSHDRAWENVPSAPGRSWRINLIVNFGTRSKRTTY